MQYQHHSSHMRLLASADAKVFKFTVSDEKDQHGTKIISSPESTPMPGTDLQLFP